MKIVLHNSESEESRAFVATLAGEHLVIIDYYKEHAITGHQCQCVNGEPYLGPDPSILPMLVEYDDTAKQWKAVNDARSITDLSDESKVYRETDEQRLEAATTKAAIEEKNRRAVAGEIVDLEVIKAELAPQKEVIEDEKPI